MLKRFIRTLNQQLIQKKKRAPLVSFILNAALVMSSPSYAKPTNQELLDFIRYYEAGGKYSAVYSGLKQKPPKELTAMSVGEVIAWQKSLGKVKSTAAGGYQFIRATLKDLVEVHRIDKSRAFDADLQDQLANLLIKKCVYKNAPKDNARFANCLAGIWAALPLVSGPNKGKSRYHGIAGNRARVTPSEVLSFLAGKGQRNKYATVQPTALVQNTQGSAPMSRVEKIKLAMAKASLTSGLGKSIANVAYMQKDATNE